MSPYILRLGNYYVNLSIDNHCKVLLVSFFHPGVVWNFPAFKYTVENQTYKNFDTLIFLDGVSSSKIDLPWVWNILNNEFNLDIPTLRYIAIQYAAKYNYEYIVFLDADDRMSPSRIECVLDNFKKYDFVANEIIPVDKNGNETGQPVLKDLFDSNIIKDYDVIFDRNLIGFSNSSIRVQVLKELKLPNIITAVDWYLFSILLLEDRPGVFIHDTNTYYTQHDTNTVGLTGALTEDTVRFYLDVKIRHFYGLELYSRNKRHKYYGDISNYLDDLLHLKNLLENDLKLQQYMELIATEHTVFNGWWERLRVSKEIIHELVSKN